VLRHRSLPDPEDRLLWELYTTGSLAARSLKHRPPVTGWTPRPAREAVRSILAGVDGCDRDPLTVAVARLRCTVAIGELLVRAGLLPAPLRLAAIPASVRPRIVVGDALLAGKVTAQEYARIHPRLAQIVNLGTSDPTRLPQGLVGVADVL
jgi:hypothetical protein